MCIYISIGNIIFLIQFYNLNPNLKNKLLLEISNLIVTLNNESKHKIIAVPCHYTGSDFGECSGRGYRG